MRKPELATALLQSATGIGAWPAPEGSLLASSRIRRHRSIKSGAEHCSIVKVIGSGINSDLRRRSETMASTSGNQGSKTGSKSGSSKSAASKESTSSASGKQGGSHEQHVKAGEQSHKNSK
jgi:hypothetical protein